MAHPLSHIPNRQIIIDGKPCMYYGGTAYLGLQSDPDFLELFHSNIETYGMHYGASRRSNVYLDVYDKAETHLAQWVGSEACLTMSSGYLAAQLLIHYLLKAGHTVIATPNAHIALQMEGVATTNTYNDVKELLRDEISKNEAAPVLLFDTIDFGNQHFPTFEAFEGLPLEKMILVGDDSHGIGIAGNQGRGCFGLLQQLNPGGLMVCCSLGKGLGVQSGAVFGDAHTIKLLRKTPFYGGASPTIPAFMGLLLNAGPIYTRQWGRLMENYHLFLSELRHPAFFDHLKGHPTFEFVDATLAQKLEKNGFIFTNFNYPDDNGPLVSRIVLSAYHTKDDILHLAHSLNNLLA